MGRLVLSFYGLCLHLTKDAGLPEGVEHRVVGMYILDQNTAEFGLLPAHFCFLQFPFNTARQLPITSPPQRDLGSQFTLDGYHMRVLNASGDFSYDPVVPGPTPPDRLPAVPSLKTYVPDMQLRPDLLEPGPPTRASCILDISHGAIVAGRFEEGAVFTTWTVDTEGDPLIQLTRADGKWLTLTVPSTAADAAFPHEVPGSLLLCNSTYDDSDKQYDFVLNYLASEGPFP